MALAKRINRLPENENFILFAACEQGDLQTLQDYLNPLTTIDIESIRDEQHATLVHYAARYGHINILEYLIEKKHLDISQLRTELAATCAHDAAVCDQVQTLHYIFHYDQLNNKNNNNNRQSLSQKLRWNVKDEQGNTPLHLAAAYGSIRTLHYLLEHESADPRIRSYNGFQPIHYAALSGHKDCLKLLLTTAPDTVNEQTSTLLTPLYLACQYGSIDLVKILSSHGANFKLRDENGLNCLHAACQSAHLHIVQWLVEKLNANVDDIDYMNNTPLHYAAANNSEDILIYLLEKGARITKSSHGNTPLHVAAENGHQSICAILIERGGCSVITCNNSQLTPIDLANHYGFSSLANSLRLHEKSSLPSQNASANSKKIQLENATIVRLVVKKPHVTRNDASNQANENEIVKDLSTNSDFTLPKKIINPRFDISELRARVDEYEAVRRGPTTTTDGNTNVLMHSMDSFNQQNKNPRRSKLPSQTYAPWLKMGNISSEAFLHEIQNTKSKLRRTKNDISEQDETNSNSSNRRSRQSQSLGPPVMSTGRNQDMSSSNSDEDFPNHRNNTPWKPTGFQARSTVNPVSKPHQFITSASQSGSQLTEPDWKRELIKRRQNGAN
ncbi:unnamed protein product [Adineta steineri]|uniref:Uncharacterized protein n=1 Tax=Adineta steineri TaxID=433720 RepID=A0A813QF84_9BILA|nr:unnamed protein product [Adineta steineri]CAF3879566.1 unnamed protein product [Adineta steineri]